MKSHAVELCSRSTRIYRHANPSILNLRYTYFRYQGLNTATQIGIPNINLGTSDTA
jgi:hypothetical protein